jgi:hypothetical protein
MPVVEHEYYNGVIREQKAEIERLRAVIKRIDAINDNPVRFSVEINDLCDSVLRPPAYQPKAGLTDE